MITLSLNKSISSLLKVSLNVITAVISKAINEILIAENIAYLSTGFGIIALNIERQEIKETVRNRWHFLLLNQKH